MAAVLGPDVIHAGIDLVDLTQFSRLVDCGGAAFLDRVFTADELAFCAGRHERLAARLAAKEAVFKVLGTGVRGMTFRDVAIVSNLTGKPEPVLSERARARALQLGIRSLAVSLSHTSKTAAAVAVALAASATEGMQIASGGAS